MLLMFEILVVFCAYGFEPFVGGVFAGDFEGEVGKPAVLRGAVPVLHFGGDMHDIARFERADGLSPLLIPATPAHAHKHLPAA